MGLQAQQIRFGVPLQKCIGRSRPDGNEPELPETRHDDAGFSIIEALVAITLIAVAFLPLLDLQLQFTRSADAIERQVTRQGNIQQAADYLSTVNFSLYRTGQQPVGGQVLYWDSEAEDTSISQRLEQTRFRVALYDVRAALLDSNSGARLYEWRVKGVGWEPEQDFQASIFSEN